MIHLLFAYKLCGRFQSEGRMPHDSDDMLWSESAANGIFSATSEPEKRRLAAEDKRFYLAVITDRPLAVVRVTLLSTVQAATAFSLSDFNYDVAMRATYRQKLPEPILAEVKKTRAFSHDSRLGTWEWSTLVVSLVSAIVILGLLLRNRRRMTRDQMPAARFMLLIVGVVIANAATCGGLSKPNARYQMRLIWLLPIAALVGGLGQLGSVPPSKRT